MKKNTQPSALILCAGFGTRLLPLTLKRPKPILPVGGVPIVLFNLLLLKEAGFKKVTLNLYHQGKEIFKLLGDGKNLGIQINYSWEKKILGTAGGVRKVLQNNPSQEFLILNGDIICDVDLKKLIHFHRSTQAQATLVATSAKKLKVSHHLYYNKQGKLLGILPKAPQPNAKKGIFTGVQILNRELIQNFPLNKKGCLVTDIYKPILENSCNNKMPLLQVFEHPGFWEDLGNLEKLKQIDTAMHQHKTPPIINKLYLQGLFCFN